jgi:hypothetical protein
MKFFSTQFFRHRWLGVVIALFLTACGGGDDSIGNPNTSGTAGTNITTGASGTSGTTTSGNMN